MIEKAGDIGHNGMKNMASVNLVKILCANQEVLTEGE